MLVVENSDNDEKIEENQLNHSSSYSLEVTTLNILVYSLLSLVYLFYVNVSPHCILNFTFCFLK